MGQIDWARLWYCVNVFITSFTALSMSLVVVSVETLRMVINCVLLRGLIWCRGLLAGRDR
jgi:hypothetical protein